MNGARAFVPGHVTGFFCVHRDDDSLRAGSRGAGVCLSDGVTVAVQPPERDVETDGSSRIVLDGEVIELDATRRVLDALGVEARVEAETPLPVSAGFGVSGAVALGTGLAANTCFGLGHTENELIATAHAAEVEAGTGLGDVVAQARGGVPIRLEPGAPEHGRLDGIPARRRVEYVTFGDRSTAEVIGGDTDDLSRAGERALADLRDAPTLDSLFDLSRRFSREADLVTPPVAETIEDVDAAGGEAAMAMLGETVIALEDGLSTAGYDATACEIHPAGATVLPTEKPMRGGTERRLRRREGRKTSDANGEQREP